MDIDWMIVLAQIANFLILIWLLKRFLYQPIRRVIQGREEKIARRVAAAEALEAQADAQKQEYERKVADIEAQRHQLLEAAREEARTMRRTLLAEAAEEAEQARRRYHESLERERISVENELGERLVEQACRTAGRVVSELAQTRLEDALIDAFEERVHGEARRPSHLGQTARSTRLTVRTSFAPSEVQRERLGRLAVAYASRSNAETDAEAGGGVDVAYEEDPSLILGIEIIAGGEAISWSARDYVNEIRQSALVPHENSGTLSMQGEVNGA